MKRMKRWMALVAAALALGMVSTSCGKQEPTTPGEGSMSMAEVHVFDAWVSSPMKDVAAVYFQAHNAGAETDHLIGVTCDRAGRAEIDQTVKTGGQMQMQPVESVPIEPDQQIAFEPGGYHVMLFDLKKRLKGGSFLPLDLTFRNAGIVHVEAEVRPHVPEESGGGM